MKTIIITGSTRGIGFGLAEQFLELGQRVVISGRRQDSVDRAVNKLSRDFPIDNILGYSCDMRDFHRVEMLWETAVDHFGAVDIWINLGKRRDIIRICPFVEGLVFCISGVKGCLNVGFAG